MGDAYTNAAALDSDTAAYEAFAYFSLRPQLMFDACCDVKPTHQTHRGSSVTFFIYDDLAAQTSTLSETADPDAIAASDSTVTVTPAEKGAVMKTTALIRLTSMLNVAEDVANLIGYNAGLSVDTLARTELSAGDNVRYAGSAISRATVTPADKLTANNARRARTDLVNNNVMPFGNYFRGFIHPDVAYDFRIDTGAGNWRDPHTYSQPAQIWSGEMGLFEGIVWTETPRAPTFSDAGSSPTTTDVYATLVTGRQALACAHGQTEGYGRYPRIVRGPRVDALQRIQPIGWKHFIGYKRFREASLRRIESGSSIGS